MSHAAAAPNGNVWLMHIARLFALAIVLGLLFVASRFTPNSQDAFTVIASVGLLLLAGMLMSDLLEVIGLPHLTGYIFAGILTGPHVLHFVDHETVNTLQPVNTLALALIALAGGAELRIDLLKQGFRGLAWATALHGTIGVVAMTGMFFLAARYIPFTQELSSTALIAVAILWGVLGTCRSPSATLGILAQLRPAGPLSRFALAFVMSSDVMIVVTMTLALTLVRPLVEPAANISLHDLEALGHEILGSLSLGTTLGLLLAIYLRFLGGRLLIPLVAMGFGLSEGLRYLRFDAVLTFLVAGFVVENLTKQGPKLMHAVEEAGTVVYVVFFATAGAHLDVPLLKTLWPVALFLTSTRALITWLTHRLGARLANDEPIVKKWGWSPLISQAGLTIGMSMLVARAFPTFGEGFRSLAIAAVAINEVVGPILFKFALDLTGETGKAVIAQPSQPPPAHPPAAEPGA
jgi:Kef-type K+ transport system membrane component KefB